jgi:integrase
MATFKTLIKKGNKRADNTWNVVIRFTHDGKVRYLPTTEYVTRKDLTSSFKIKNQKILDKCDDIIRGYRKKVSSLNLEINDIDIDDIISYLKKKDDNTGIDFIDFSRKWCEKHTEIKGIKNYKTSINSLCAFFGRNRILCGEITVKKMKEYEEYLSGKTRAKSLYPSMIIRLFNEARDFYNDEDNNVIRIKNSLRKYVVPQQNVAEKRALTIEEIKSIFNLPYNGLKSKGLSSHHDIALDCYKLSFFLMGMNSADIYNCTDYDGEYITYFRTKTKDRRNDNAEMKIKVHPCINDLVEKYKGSDHVFNFCKRYSSLENFNRAINMGLKEVGKEIGIEKLQFYSARHSFATIAVNEVRIPPYIVNDMLCHVDSSMKVTELYIKKDFTEINEANFRFIDYFKKNILYRNI